MINYTEGKIIKFKGKLLYSGQVPNFLNESVIILRKSDLEMILKAEKTALLIRGQDMPQLLYTLEDGQPSIADEIVIQYEKNQTRKMFLDRHIYSMNFKDEIWIRYVDVDQSFIEEEGEIK